MACGVYILVGTRTGYSVNGCFSMSHYQTLASALALWLKISPSYVSIYKKMYNFEFSELLSFW